MHGLLDRFVHREDLRGAMRVDSAGHLHIVGSGDRIDDG